MILRRRERAAVRRPPNPGARETGPALEAMGCPAGGGTAARRRLPEPVRETPLPGSRRSNAGTTVPGRRLRTARAAHVVEFVLNGARCAAEAPPRLLLSDFLRHRFGRRGVHVGCEHGVCGACTVRLDGAPARACLLFAVQVHGRRVDTVESLAGPDGAHSPLQSAFRRHHALQCGYCTPGILMTMTEWLERLAAEGRNPGEDDVRAVLSGHLCRCTGYEPIVAAVLDAARDAVRARDRPRAHGDLSDSL